LQRESAHYFHRVPHHSPLFALEQRPQKQRRKYKLKIDFSWQKKTSPNLADEVSKIGFLNWLIQKIIAT